MSSPEIKKVAESATAPTQENTSSTLISERFNGSASFEAGEVLSTRFDSLHLMSARWDADFYLAGDPSQGTENGQIALKVFPPQASGDLKRLELFLLEAFTAAKLTHRNIIRSSQPEQINGIYYYRLEHRPETETLKDLLDREGWLDIRTAVGVISQIADALEYAHERGVLHLRIQPEDILIDSHGTAFLTDFGIEQKSDLAWARMERASHCPIHYISPEQARGGALDVRSDLYSLGVVLYQLLTDRLPVDSEDPESVREKHLTQSPLSPHLYLPDIPVALSDVVTCLLEKDPARRFQDVRSFRAALEKSIASTAPPTLRVEEGQFKDPLAESQPPNQPTNKGAENDGSSPRANEQINHREEATTRVDTPVEVYSREQWETPSIRMIHPPPDSVHSVQSPPATAPQTRPQHRVEREQAGHLINAASPTVLSSQYATNSQLRPVILVVVLAIAAVGGLLVLARFDRPKNMNPTPVPVTATSSVRDAASDRSDPSSTTGDPDPSIINQPAASPQKLGNPNSQAESTATRAVADRGSSESRAQPGTMRRSQQRSGQPKRKWRRPSRYRGNYFFNR